MAAAIVEVLVAVEHPHLGCALRCVELKWDDVGSSAAAFYRATRGAWLALRDEATWSFRPARR